MLSKQEELENQLKTETQKWARSRGQALCLPISVQQAATARDFPAKGPQWVSRTVLKAPGDSEEIELAVQNALKNMTDWDEDVPPVTVADVHAHWTTYKPSAKVTDEEPSGTEKSKYEGLIVDVTSKTTILYAHGGYFYAGGAANSRHTTLALVRETRGRCLVVEYRLAPQHPFPSAIADLLISYLSLLYPEDDAFHEPVRPEHIVLAGESSGGNLVLSLLSLLQFLHSNSVGGITFRGRKVPIPLPAGIATLCAHTDLTSSSPSQVRNKSYDIFYLDKLPYLQPDFPSCRLWPSNPPRGEIYCNTAELLHPLVSVEISPVWSDSKLPPMFFAYGQEMILDEGRGLAQRARSTGTIVQFLQYDCLPHIFPLLFPKLPQSQHALRQWAAFIHKVVYEPEELQDLDMRFSVVDHDFEGTELILDVETDVEKRKAEMRKAISTREPWTGSSDSSKL